MVDFVKSALLPYFERVPGDIIPGAHRLQKLLSKYIDYGIFEFPCILVTGSNGKGSTCAYLERILREHNLITGLYTSPHLIHPNERIRINGVPVTELILEENLNEIQEQVSLTLPDATFFEITTACALLIFLKEKIDFLICEVGLGGHFDSTNALSPLLSILTSVSLEHTQFLGNSLKKISADKSHISRRNKPFIVTNISAEAMEGVRETTQKIGSYIVPVEISNDRNINLQTALTAIKHLSTVTKLKFDTDKTNFAIQQMFWPGRFDVRTINSRIVIFDAAHNPEGFDFFLNAYSKSLFSKTKCVLLFASLNDKDWKTVLKKFPIIAEHIILTQIDSERAESIENFASEIQNQKLYFPNFDTFKNCADAIEKSMNTLPHLPLVITGSIAFIGNVMEQLNVEVFRN